jgi:large subunit ribosomal protein L5
MARKDKEKPPAPTKLLPPRLKAVHKEKVGPAMREQFGYSSTMQIPTLTKIVVNMGTGSEEKEIDNYLRDMTSITGQKPVVTKAKKSVSNFKVREGMKVGCSVTLRGDRMWHFFDKLCTVALPRIRDFQGLPLRSFDGRGNYSIGLKEQLVFTEIDYDTFDKIRGMDVTVVTTAKSDAEGAALLKGLGMPLKEK